MLKRKLSTAIIAAVFMASPMIVPTFVLASPQDGQQDKMKDDKMKDDKMGGDKMAGNKMAGDKMAGDKMDKKRHKRHKKPKQDDKMQSNNNQ
jgi:pentapeptide MXKDX repeat protein